MTDQYGNQEYLISDLPLAPKIAYWGLVVSMVLAVFFNFVFAILRKAFPGFDVADQGWFIPFLCVIWTPMILSFLCAYYSIIRFPDLSRFVRMTSPVMTTPNSCIWPLLGQVMMLVGFVAFFFLFDDEQPLWGGRLASGYLGIVLFFNGYLLGSYVREKNVVIATFFDTTQWFGVILVPIFIPALILGRLHLNRMERRKSSKAKKPVK